MTLRGTTLLSYSSNCSSRLQIPSCIAFLPFNSSYSRLTLQSGTLLPRKWPLTQQLPEKCRACSSRCNARQLTTLHAFTFFDPPPVQLEQLRLALGDERSRGESLGQQVPFPFALVVAHDCVVAEVTCGTFLHDVLPRCRVKLSASPL